MKTASVSLAAILLFTLVTTGCFSLPNNELVQSIVKQVGATVPQAVGASGALLNLAQRKLPSADAAKLSQTVPDMNLIVEQSKSLGGYSNVNSLADANAGMAKLGMNLNQASQMPQVVAGYVESKAGSDVAGLLQNIWR